MATRRGPCPTRNPYTGQPVEERQISLTSHTSRCARARRQKRSHPSRVSKNQYRCSSSDQFRNWPRSDRHSAGPSDAAPRYCKSSAAMAPFRDTVGGAVVSSRVLRLKHSQREISLRGQSPVLFRLPRRKGRRLEIAESHRTIRPPIHSPASRAPATGAAPPTHPKSSKSALNPPLPQRIPSSEPFVGQF